MFSSLRVMQRWLRGLFAAPRQAARRPRHRPHFDVLEDRRVLSAALLVQMADNTPPLAIKNGEALSSDGLYRIAGDSEQLEALAASLSLRPGVSYVEFDQQVSIAAVPNDPKFSDGSLWGLNGTNGIGAPGAWDTTTGSAKVAVGVIDSGVDYKHPDLYLNIWINQAEIPLAVKNSIQSVSNWDVDGDGLITFWDLNDSRNQGTGKITDLDGDGRITAADILRPSADGGWADAYDTDQNNRLNDLIGWDFINNDNDPYDDNGHGTHVAGTIGAIGNNSTGVAGVNWKTQIVALKFIGSGGTGSTSHAISALQYASLKGVKITNNSWGSTSYSTALYNAIAGARSYGHLFIAAAGNSGANNDSTGFYPAGYNLDNIIAVAATTSSAALASYSNYGATTVDVGAPGSGILSTTPSNTYSTYNGTSMASPHVAGVAALMWANTPTWSYGQIRDLLFDTVRPLSSLSGKTATGGIINAAGAVKNAPEIQVLDGATILRDGAASVSLGSTNLGSPLYRTLRIKNLGNQALNLGTFSLPTGFSLSTPPSSTSIAALGSVSFTISLTATSAGTFSGNLVINSNDGDEGSFEIAVSGHVAGNNPPVLTQPADQTMPTTQDTRSVTLSASDPNGDPLTYSATVVSQAYQLDQQYGFYTDGNLYENWGGIGEKWFLGAGAVWYFIKTNGDIFRWDGSSQATGTFLVNVETVYHSNPALLYNAVVGASVSVSGNVVTVNPNSGFIGKLYVTATVSDGSLSDSKTFTVNVIAAVNNPPVLTPPSNQTMPTTQDTLAVALSASDADGDTLTYSATVESEAYRLDQQHGFYTDGNQWFNWGGQNEKWFLAAGGVWHFIKPNGDVLQWDGSSQATGTLKFTLQTAYYDDPSKLYNATRGASVSLSGNTLTVNPDSGFVGKLYVTATVSDGTATDTETFTVTVTA